MSSVFSLSIRLGKKVCIGHGAAQEVCSVHVGSVNSQEAGNGWVRQLQGAQVE